MALTSPALTLSIEALFGNIKPALDTIRALGPTDFSADAPGVQIKPGATIKVPLSTVGVASAFDEATNNYLTGGTTTWASLTASHYLQGFDISGTNVDQGVNAGRMKQLFASRAGTGISMAAIKAIRTALDGTTASTGVQLPAAPTLADYDGLTAAKDWYDASQSVLAVNGAEWALLKAAFHAKNLSASPRAMAEELGFRDVILVSGMTARAVIVPYGSIGFIARVPALVAGFREAGVETDPDSGLSVGIVVADDQAKNRLVANADLWFGVAAKSANAAATEAGIIKVGTKA